MSGEHITVVNETINTVDGRVNTVNRILIIDDDEDILEGYKYIFESEGFEAHTACTPEEALNMVKKQHFDTALLDYMLPNMRGDELGEKLHSINPSIKLVIISGFSNVEEVFEARNIKIAGVVRKPVLPEDLVGLMKEISRE
jgi:DNA-binding NtrC family response regulator